MSSNSNNPGKAPPKFKKKMWTEDEDALLVSLVDKFGSLNWVVISQHMPNRTGKQCRERYLNKFKEGIKNTQWTAEEDQLILEKQAILGNSWVKIAEFIPGRSADAIKTRYSWIKTKSENKSKHSSSQTTPSQTTYVMSPAIDNVAPINPSLAPDPNLIHNPFEEKPNLPTTQPPMNMGMPPYAPEPKYEQLKPEEPKISIIDQVPMKSKANHSLPTIFEDFQTTKFPCSTGSTILNLSFLEPESMLIKKDSTDDCLFSTTDSVFTKRDPNCFWNKQ